LTIDLRKKPKTSRNHKHRTSHNEALCGIVSDSGIELVKYNMEH